MSTQAEKANALRALHHPGKPLVLVNVWDAFGARIIEDLGYPALATSSASVAWAHGYADGERIPLADVLAMTEAIVRCVDIPVTADLEAGYGPTANDAAFAAQGAIAAGAVGMNFEDVNRAGEFFDRAAQVARVAAVVETGASSGVPIVLNARTDAFLADIGPGDGWRLKESIERGNAYLAAGADCIFVPGVDDEATIEKLVAGIRGKVSVLAGYGSPSIERYAQLGVSRVSVGSASAGATYAHFRSLASDIRDHRRFDELGDRMSFREANSLFTRR
jgi:2-methylisocitrate lyase-like PEP mutase family enzyme